MQRNRFVAMISLLPVVFSLSCVTLPRQPESFNNPVCVGDYKYYKKADSYDTAATTMGIIGPIFLVAGLLTPTTEGLSGAIVGAGATVAAPILGIISLVKGKKAKKRWASDDCEENP